MFKWDLSSIKDNIKRVEKDNRYKPYRLYEFDIKVTTTGYVSGIYQPDAMERYANSLAKLFSFDIYESDSSHIIDKDIRVNTEVSRNYHNTAVEIKYGWGHYGYCYAHPSQWTGYGTSAFINALEQALNDMSTEKEPIIISYEKKEVKPLLPLDFSNYEAGYKRLLAANTEGIIKFFEEECQDIDNDSFIGFRFAEKYRLKDALLKENNRFISNHSGYTADDIDIEFVNNLYLSYKVMKEMGIIDYSKLTDKNKNKDADYER